MFMRISVSGLRARTEVPQALAAAASMRITFRWTAALIHAAYGITSSRHVCVPRLRPPLIAYTCKHGL